MIECIVFDLSEVIIAGLLGVERILARRHGVDEGRVLEHLGGESLNRLCRGECSEVEYLAAVRAAAGWDLGDDALRRAVRENFANRVEGMPELVERLAPKYELVLLSDHGQEWIEHIEQVHPFLKLFPRRVFSFHTGLMKTSVLTFERLLETIQRAPATCLFIDDNPGNVANAQAAGMAAVRFLGVTELERELARHGVE